MDEFGMDMCSFDYNMSTEVNITLSEACCVFGPDLTHSVFYQSIVYLMFGLIFVIALVGNGFVCFTVKTTPRMHTVTNYFIVNLAIGDFLMALFCVPSTSVSTFILQYWPFGGFMCLFVNYVQAISVFVSAYTLVAISVDRYIVIMWPLKPRVSKKNAAVIVMCVWLFALLTALPIPITSKLIMPTPKYKMCDRYICVESWSDLRHRTYYSVALFILQVVIPLSILMFTYTRIAIVVWSKRFPGEAENSRDQRMARSKRKMVKMMITVVIVYTLCWLPFNLFWVMMEFTEGMEDTYTLYIWATIHWLAMSHTCYNPIIYCYMNSRFRAGFFDIIRQIPCCGKLLLSETHHNFTGSSVAFPSTGEYYSTDDDSLVSETSDDASIPMQEVLLKSMD